MFASATTYSDGEDGTTDGWRVHDNSPSGATIENISDNNSRVIKLQGEGRANAYMLGAKKPTRSNAWKNQDNQIFSWKMKISEKFRITIYTNTKKGLRVFNVTHSSKNKGLYREKYIGIGLGKKSKNGQWQSFSIDLKKELQKYEFYNEITSINGIKVRGSGLFDDIELTNDIVTHVKDICANHKKAKDVICLEPFNQAYYINHEMINETNVLHAISTDGTWREIKQTYLESKHDVTLKKLEKTPLVQVNTYEWHSSDANLYYSNNEKETLTKLLTIHSDDTFRTDSIETIENGTKLVVKFHHNGSGERFVNIYDISNLPEIPLIESK
jgi:hypothetical protein